MLDYRDWTSYVYVPLLVPPLVLLPYLVVKSYERSHRISQIVESLSQGSRDLEKMTSLLENKSTPWLGEEAEEVRKLDEPDYKGFEFFQDSRILDMRSWKAEKSGKSEPTSLVYAYRRLKVLKQSENAENNLLRIPLFPTSPKTVVRFPLAGASAKVAANEQGRRVWPPAKKVTHWQVTYDFEHVPAGDFVDLVFEYHSPGLYLQRGEHGTRMTFPVLADTAELTTWILMPEGKEYRGFRIVRYETGKPEKVEAVKVVTEYLAEDYTILAFKLLSLKHGHTYDVGWLYK